MKKLKTLISHSFEDTLKIAEEFSKSLKPGMNISLNGELGSGKTAFVRAVYEILGRDNEIIVSSPTFTLLHEYPTPHFTITHFDLYRLDTYEQWESLDFEEYLKGPSVCFVEWADKFSQMKNYYDAKIEFKILGESQREIVFK